MLHYMLSIVRRMGNMKHYINQLNEIKLLVTRYNKCSMPIKLQNMVVHLYAILTLTIANVLLHISLNISKKPFLLNKA